MNKISFFLISTFFFIQFSQLYSQDILIAAHRGANRVAPENTMASAKKAVEMGAHFLEVDVRQSKDGVFFNFHDRTLDRTTNGTGNFIDFTSEELKKLDAGSWFRHEFAGERIPTIEEQVMAFRDEIYFYFDFKDGDLAEFISLVKSWGIHESCFFNTRGNFNEEDVKLLQEAGIDFKVNVSSVEEFHTFYKDWNHPMIEVRAHDLSRELVNAAHEKGVKVMVYVPGDQVLLLKYVLRFDIDLINLDNPDIFKYILRHRKFPEPLWIAHRGTVVNDDFLEYQPEGIAEAFKRNYAGVEFDIWKTTDGHLVVHHDRDLNQFFNVDKNIDELSLAEAKQYRSISGDFGILTLDEYLDLIPLDAVLMLDIKVRDRTPEFYSLLRKSIERRHGFKNTIFIDRDARNHFWGESRFSVRVREMPEIIEKWRNGEDVASNYFLFDHGNVLSAQWVKAAQMMSMEVIPSVNVFHYRLENFLFGGIRDITFLYNLGVRTFQIDAVFEENLEMFNSLFFQPVNYSYPN